MQHHMPKYGKDLVYSISVEIYLKTNFDLLFSILGIVALVRTNS